MIRKNATIRRYYKLAKCKFHYADMLVYEITGEPEAGLSPTIARAFKPSYYDIEDRQAFARDMTAMLKMYLAGLQPLLVDQDYDTEDRDIIRHAADQIEAAIMDIGLFAKI